MDYLYDGSFDGLLTCIYEYYYTEVASQIIERKYYQQKLFEEYKEIETDKEKSQKVFNAIKTKISKEALHHIYNCFLSNNLMKDNYILRYIVCGFKIGTKIDALHTHKDVLPVHRLSKRVGTEGHRFLEILRFREISGVLYSSINPDNNILSLIINHFADRLKNERFIIHDIPRKEAVIYEKGSYYFTDFNLNLSTNEYIDEYEKLWTGYFKTIGIESRKNLKLQQSFVPKKYRRNIIEFSIKSGGDK